ncbi:SEC-C domain-containing protein [Paenibacillus sp. O199]|uniref:YecA family protein n=1 Tax=Paenibacillus sp. O199 TaxID=1643925 RepID=UPI0007BFAA4C|nr:SEC-C domain-containing protein [Paenibacillus sp. O199]
MKIGRNDLCTCGSGKKYKMCHMQLPDKPLIDSSIPINSALDRRISKNLIKQCIHPNQNECKGEPIKAHSIQNNRILSKLGRNGDLYVVKMIVNETTKRMNPRFKTVGRKKATTFSGFCSHHDKELFQPIEDQEYYGTEHQKFLFSYRTFSFEYHKKSESVKLHKNNGNDKPSLLTNDEYLGFKKGYDLSTNDNDYTKKIYDEALLTNDYAAVETVEIVLQKEVLFSVSSGFYLEYDLTGRKINDLLNPESQVHLMTLNVFPDNDRTVILFSWLRRSSEVYFDFKQQLLGLTDTQLQQLLNSMIPSYCENVVYNPDFIDNMSSSKKSDYLKVYSLTTLDFIPSNIKKNLLATTSYTLF